jgi:hypothetical protein
MGRNYLKGRGGDRINAVLASCAGWSGFCAPCCGCCLQPGASPKCLKNAHPRFFTDD